MQCAYCSCHLGSTQYDICDPCYKNFARVRYHPVLDWRPLSSGWHCGLWVKGAYVVRNGVCVQLYEHSTPYTQYIDQDQEQFVAQVLNAEAKCPFDYLYGPRGEAYYYKNPSPAYQQVVESWTKSLANDVIRYIRARQYRIQIVPESNLSRPPASWLPKVAEWIEDKKLECLMSRV